MAGNQWSESYFHKNIDLFKSYDPLTAHQLEISRFSNFTLSQTKDKELNLLHTKYGIKDYIHPQEGALAEAKKIVEEEIQKKSEIIYFYGVGFGYIYEALKEWLHAKEHRHLVLIEHDLEILYHLFHTSLATELLQDPQVTLQCYSDIESEFSQEKLNHLLIRFSHHEHQFLVLPSYILRQESMALNLCYKILREQSTMKYIYREYFTGQYGFVSNFYSNLMTLPNASISTHLYGKFKNIPAIVCGAGPSLEKNIDLLKQLSDRALIFAGGSSLNVLNAYNFTPHFGIGIDPNPEQYHRLLSNHTFHLPLFFRNRMEHRALKLMPGPKIYVPGSDNKLAYWYENKLGIETENLDEGQNVVNFSTQIARMMGCNPIIFVGLDLAFTEVKSYASGISTHPIWLSESNPYIQEKKQVIARNSIDGQKILTKWEWLEESDWVSRFAQQYADIKVINSTEGGLGFQNVPNISLQEVVDQYLTQSYDLSGRVFSEIQDSQSNIQPMQILRSVNEFRTTIQKCADLCRSIVDSLIKKLNEGTVQTKSSFFISSHTIHFESLLEEEEGYKFFLNQFDRAQAFFERAQSRVQPLEKYLFLESVAKQHLNFLFSAVQKYVLSPAGQNNEIIKTEKANKAKLYSFEDNRLIIKDNDLALDFNISFTPTPKIEYYPDESIKSEQFYNEKQALQGPSRFYSNKGIMLSESWFVDGKKEGITKLNYANGNTYGMQSFKEGLMHGKQQYFFANGAPMCTMFYNNGVLDGRVTVYNNDGQLIRELHYKNGKRHGSEKMWDNNNKLILECKYKDGIPFGTAQEWFSNGKLKKEVKINKFPKNFDSTEWDEHQKIAKSFKNGIEDYSFYFEEKRAQADWLEGVIKIITDRLDRMLKEDQNPLLESSKPELMKELDETKKALAELVKLKEELKEIQDSNIKNAAKARKKIKSNDKDKRKKSSK